MSVRAKFECKSVGDGQVKLEVVYTGSKENEQFFKWTPSGQIQMGIVNEAALGQFEVGKQYYVDFSPADGA
jgi:hypothetical protein